MYKCEECGLEFESFQAKANHYRWKHLKYAFKNPYTKELTRAKSIQREERKHGEYIKEYFICKTCGKTITIIHRKNTPVHRDFCSKECANKARIRTKESRKKTSDSIKNAWKIGKYNTASYHEKQNKNKIFSSKIERSIIEYFKNTYPEYEWKSGGQLIYNGVRITRDLYSDILKLCFEYDGIWHFKDIHGQLQRKQLVDKTLEEWCIKHKYRLIRIDENDYINFKQIEKLIFETTEPIIKIGKRY